MRTTPVLSGVRTIAASLVAIGRSGPANTQKTADINYNLI
jgi:hypothetical protein